MELINVMNERSEKEGDDGRRKKENIDGGKKRTRPELENKGGGRRRDTQ